MICAFVVMKCEGFGYITDLADYLENNRLIAYYCGFDITKKLPSYWTYDRFLWKLDHSILEEIMQTQVKQLYELGVLDASFIGLDSQSCNCDHLCEFQPYPDIQQRCHPRKTNISG